MLVFDDVARAQRDLGMAAQPGTAAAPGPVAMCGFPGAPGARLDDGSVI